MLHTWLSVIFLIANVNIIDCLDCFTCTDVEDPDNCHNTSQCLSGQSCFADSRTNGQTRTYTLGCTDNKQCGTITGINPGIVGRDIQVRQTEQCHECCSTDNCNNLLCHHLKPSTCIDDVKVDCAFLNAMFNICQDIHHSKTVCPKFCQLCSLVDGNWAEWTQWSTCDVSCGNGTQTRARSCTNPVPSNKGLDCVGKSTDSKFCVRSPCPVHGGWTKWSEWGACSKTCDVGIQRRNRNCTNPYPLRYGDHCFGDAIDDRLCMPRPCANGGWSDWGSWTSCSISCGGGFRSKSRNCSHPRPSPFGQFCDGDSVMIESCNEHACSALNVIFNAYYLSSQNVAPGQTLIFTRSVVNVGDAYNNSTGEFTAPVNGIYSFNAHLCIYSPHELFFNIKIGGMTYATAYGHDQSSVQCSSAQSSASVRKGEKVIIQWAVTTITGSNIYQSSTIRNYFSGHLVSQIF